MKKENKKILITAFFVLMLFNSSIFANVTLLVPRNGEELTDIAVAFKGKVTGDGPYKLQVSKNQNFSGTVITKTTSAKHDVNYNFVYFFSLQGDVDPSKKFILEPGTWYWRMSDDNGSTWSGSRKLIVNNNKPLTPLGHPISEENPLFHFRIGSRFINESTDLAQTLSNIVPTHMKNHMVLDIEQSFTYTTKGSDLLAYSKKINDLGYKFIFDLGAPDALNRATSLAELEQVFKDLPNCIGAGTSELFYGYFFNEDRRSQFDGALELCRKYGKVFLYGDMNWRTAKWQQFGFLNHDKFKQRQYAKYFVPMNKNTDPWGAYTNVCAIQGMQLTGMVDNIGMWSDLWCWEKFGQPDNFDGLTDFLEGTHSSGGTQQYHPYIQNIKQHIYGITYGSTVFVVEGNEQWGKGTGELNDNYSRFIAPFMDAVIEEKIIPSRESIHSSFKVIVDTEFPSYERSQVPVITYLNGNIWGDFLRSTFGITNRDPYNTEYTKSSGEKILKSVYTEMYPNTDRYPSGIPFLPKPGISAPVVNGTALKIEKISDLDTKAKVNSKLNTHYPETGNEAYARKIDKSFFVFNTLENHNVKQSYSVGINHGDIQTLSGNIDLMSYVIGKCRDDGKTVFVQANAYVEDQNLIGRKYSLPTYPTILNFKCANQPTLASNEMSAITKSWNASTKILKVEINHSSAGAVNFTLQGSGTTTQAPYGGSARSIPGTIEVEEYDEGGEGVAYHDTDASNNGPNIMRESDGVDIESRDGSNNVGWTADGEWLEYTVNATAGSYDIEARVATTSTGKSIIVKLDGATLGTFNCPNTGGWGTFQTIKLSNIAIAAKSSKILRLEFVGGGVNLNWVKFASAPQSPYGGNVRNIPGTIEAEEFDNGGEGLAYHDTDASNNGPDVMRETESVDIESRDGSNIVGWTADGEWLEYTVNATAGSYDIEARVATTSTGKSIVVKLDGATLGTFNCPNTGGWGTFQTIKLSNVAVTAKNNKILRFEFVGGGINLNWIKFNSVSTNQVLNPGFETGDLTSWAGWGTREVVSESYAGAHGLKLTGAGSLVQVISVQPNTSYTLSAQGKVENGSSVSLGVKDYGAADKSVVITSTSYTSASISFTTGASNTTAKIFFYVPNSGNIAYGDNFSVIAGKSAFEPIAQNQEELELQIYPNPITNDVFNIQIPEYSGAISINIFDIHGKSVHQSFYNEASEIQVNISDLQIHNGIYFLNVVCSDKTYIKKIILK